MCFEECQILTCVIGIFYQKFCGIRQKLVKAKTSSCICCKINHVNNDIHSIKLEKVLQEANKFKTRINLLEKDNLLLYPFLVNVPIWYTLKSFGFLLISEGIQ